jgi:hypothetical protein
MQAVRFDLAATGLVVDDLLDPVSTEYMVEPVKQPGCAHIMDRAVGLRLFTQAAPAGVIGRAMQIMNDKPCPMCRAEWQAGSFAAVPDRDRIVQDYVLDRLRHNQAHLGPEEKLYLYRKSTPALQVDPAGHTPLPNDPIIARYITDNQVELQTLVTPEMTAQIAAAKEVLAHNAPLNPVLQSIINVLKALGVVIGPAFSVASAGGTMYLTAVLFTAIDPVSACVFGAVSQAIELTLGKIFGQFEGISILSCGIALIIGILAGFPLTVGDAIVLAIFGLLTGLLVRLAMYGLLILAAVLIVVPLVLIFE